MSFRVCPYCKKQVNTKTDLSRYDEESKRWFHEACHIVMSEERTARKELIEYICQLFGYKRPPSKVYTQMTKYIEEQHYTYVGILNTVRYFYEIKNGAKDKANGGIGIVPYVYEEANAYYSKVEKKQSNFEKTFEQEEFIEVEITIKPHRHKNFPSAIDIDKIGR